MYLLIFLLLATGIPHLLDELSGKAVVALYFWLELSHKAYANHSFFFECLLSFVQLTCVDLQS